MWIYLLTIVFALANGQQGRQALPVSHSIRDSSSLRPLPYWQPSIEHSVSVTTYKDGSSRPLTNISKPRVSGIATQFVRGAGNRPAYPGVIGGPSSVVGLASSAANDFNPALRAGGIIGGPGIRVRINQRTFTYLSALTRYLMDRLVCTARIPPITQKIAEVCGEITLCNIHVSNYRSPRDIQICPSPPNRININIIDFDIGITGNIDGVANIILPIKLFGIIHANLYHVSLSISIEIRRAPNGALYIVLCNCNLNIGYVDICIDCGGLVGDIINTLGRRLVSDRVKEMIPGQVCGMLPGIINSRINPLLAGIPQAIGFDQLVSLVGNLLRSNVPERCLSPLCQGNAITTAAPFVATSAAALPPPVNPPAPSFVTSQNNIATSQRGLNPVQEPQYQQQILNSNSVQEPQYQQQRFTGNRNHLARFARPLHHTIPTSFSHFRNKRDTVSGTVRQRRLINKNSRVVLTLHQRNRMRAPTLLNKRNRIGSSVVHSVRSFRGPGGPSVSVAGPQGPNGFCAGCPTGSAGSMELLRAAIMRQIDFRRLSDIMLTVQVLNLYATPYDYTIDINGEFSPRGLGGTPFGPYPLSFPRPIGGSMIEILISDFSINSLFYAMHRRNFLSLRIGSDFPGIGAILKTDCDSGEDYDLDEGDVGNSTIAIFRYRLRQIVRLVRARYRSRTHKRVKRQDLSSLADLGFCFGSLAPALKERYPNSSLYLIVHSARAPSIMLSARGGGMATLDAVIFADIYLEGTNTRVGTISITIVLDVSIRIFGNRISANAVFRTLRLSDRDNTLGLPQDALDNLSSLARDVLIRSLNQNLNQGFPIQLPTANLPIQIINPQISIVERGIYIASDFVIQPSALNSIMI